MGSASSELPEAVAKRVSEERIFSVGRLTRTIKETLESNSDLREIWVRGEISNLTYHLSGHVYFTLKDENSQIKCTMWKSNASNLKFKLASGGKTIVRGSVEVYEPRGEYQLIVKEAYEDGLGDLHKRFLLLKEKLSKEGLFAEEHKKRIPKFPKTIGVITSPTGAVFHDICNVISRRFPHVRILLVPAKVQGDDGAQSIVAAIHTANGIKEIDLIILARGGGSLEDLWCFNEESVARAVYSSEIPIVSGIGHETDFTIADFVSDKRAPTPSAAAEIIVPDAMRIETELQQYADKLVRGLQNFVSLRSERLDGLTIRLIRSMKYTAQNKSGGVKTMQGKLGSLDPTSVLKRGFSITLLGKQLVIDAKQVKRGDKLKTVLASGQISSEVE
ncbi:Exodeoxyribonuclease 7 large subunit [Candidatus Norongarragalina meridionalis]|nr:Exodeoxyribonuclease 7 large subunit [Candidatus Norongarragalina meridionalis]